jgi:hypothetical protein
MWAEPAVGRAAFGRSISEGIMRCVAASRTDHVARDARYVSTFSKKRAMAWRLGISSA